MWEKRAKIADLSNEARLALTHWLIAAYPDYQRKIDSYSTKYERSTKKRYWTLWGEQLARMGYPRTPDQVKKIINADLKAVRVRIAEERQAWARLEEKEEGGRGGAEDDPPPALLPRLTDSRLVLYDFLRSLPDDADEAASWEAPARPSTSQAKRSLLAFPPSPPLADEHERRDEVETPSKVPRLFDNIGQTNSTFATSSSASSVNGRIEGRDVSSAVKEEVAEPYMQVTGNGINNGRLPSTSVFMNGVIRKEDDARIRNGDVISNEVHDVIGKRNDDVSLGRSDEVIRRDDDIRMRNDDVTREYREEEEDETSLRRLLLREQLATVRLQRERARFEMEAAKCTLERERLLLDDERERRERRDGERERMRDRRAIHRDEFSPT